MFEYTNYKIILCCGATDMRKSINGFWIHFKRIERGQVVWPIEQNDEKTMVLAYDDLKNIIITPGIIQKIKRTEVWKKC
jgi:hypothetical protein